MSRRAGLASLLAIAGLAVAGSAPAPDRVQLPEGRLLVEVPGRGLAIVGRDGGHRFIGRWYDSDWAPDGKRVTAVRGSTVVALDLIGRVRWRVEAGSAAAAPRWAPDGRRVAYRAGSSLYAVDADGTHRERVAAGLRYSGAAWRPGGGHQLAWADRAGQLRLRDVVSGHTAWTTSAGPPVLELAWSRAGSTLVARSATRARVIDARSGRLLRMIRARGTRRFEAAAFAPTGASRLLLVSHDVRHGGSRVLLTPTRRAQSPRPVFTGRGRIVDLTFSPSHAWLLIGWRGGDEWRFVRWRGRDGPLRVRGVSRRFTPSAGRWAFPSVRGWCCR